MHDYKRWGKQSWEAAESRCEAEYDIVHNHVIAMVVYFE